MADAVSCYRKSHQKNVSKASNLSNSVTNYEGVKKIKYFFTDSNESWALV